MAKVTIMCGLPNSGKSTSVSYSANAIFSGDDYLMRLATDEFGDDISYTDAFRIFSKERKIDYWGMCLNDAKKALHMGSDIVVDGTHMSKKSRRRVCTILGVKEAHVILVLRSFDKMMNLQREGKHIPQSVYKQMVNSFSAPIDETNKGITFTSELRIVDF